jgi:hypothetical protein
MFHLSDPTSGIQAIKFVHLHSRKTHITMKGVGLKSLELEEATPSGLEGCSYEVRPLGIFNNSMILAAKDSSWLSMWALMSCFRLCFMSSILVSMVECMEELMVEILALIFSFPSRSWRYQMTRN